MFQHTAARRRLENGYEIHRCHHAVSTHSRPKAAGFFTASMRLAFSWFQHTAARRRLDQPFHSTAVVTQFQHTAARRRLGRRRGCIRRRLQVSTHSRPKAAGEPPKPTHFTNYGFNTQPPEGGWPIIYISITLLRSSFNTQPPEGGWSGLNVVSLFV